MDDILLGDFRKMCDRTCKVQLCMRDTIDYDEYRRVDLVPDDYDGMRVVGVGLVESEPFQREPSDAGRDCCALEVLLAGR